MLFWLGFIFTLTYSSWRVYKALLGYNASQGFWRLSWWLTLMILSTVAWVIIMRFGGSL